MSRLRRATRPGTQETGERHRQRIFDDPFEKKRRQQGIEESAQHAAERYPEVELRQPLRRRPRPRELPMTHHRGEKQDSRWIGRTKKGSPARSGGWTLASQRHRGRLRLSLWTARGRPDHREAPAPDTAAAG